AKDVMHVRIDRRRKLPVTTLLYALDSGETEKLRARREAQEKPLQPGEAVGMSKEEILNAIYATVYYTRTKQGWKTAYKAEAWKGVKLNFDLINAKGGEVVVEAGQKVTARKAKQLEEEGLKEILLQTDQLAGQYLASDIIDEKSGLVLFEAGDEITGDM